MQASSKPEPESIQPSVPKEEPIHHPRRSSFASERSIAIGVSEKEWEKDLEKRSTSDTGSSIREPEKALTKSEHEAHAHHGKKDDPEQHPVQRTVTAQDWTGPDDPENPHNWSLLKRIYHTIPPALFGFVV